MTLLGLRKYPASLVKVVAISGRSASFLPIV
jgi:hypothetical protein